MRDISERTKTVWILLFEDLGDQQMLPLKPLEEVPCTTTQLPGTAGDSEPHLRLEVDGTTGTHRMIKLAGEDQE